MSVSSTEYFQALKQKFYAKNIVVAAPSESSFRLIERILVALPELHIQHAHHVIDTLADIFILKPLLVIVFCDSNQETLHLIRLIRNHPAYRDLPVMAVYHQPPTLWQRWQRGLRICATFETPLVNASVLTEVRKVCQLDATVS